MSLFPTRGDLLPLVPDRVHFEQPSDQHILPLGTQPNKREHGEPAPIVAFADRLPVARVLAFIATAGRAVDFEDCRHSAELAEFEDDQIAGALVALVYGGHLECRKVAIRYREGDRLLRREVPVYYLARREGGEA